MNILSKLVAASIAVSGSAVAAIETGTPLVSGDVARFEAGHETGRRDFSQHQLQALSDWLGAHRSAWQGMIAPATSEPEALAIGLKDAEGRSGSIAVVVRAHGARYLRFLSSSSSWSYESFGGLFKTWAATRELTPEELDQLLRAVGMLEAPK